ncbi:MAG: SH3-like domain-containing protein [Kiloniellaceae bacterium]
MPMLAADAVPEVLRKGRSARIDVEIEPRFKPGDRVVVRNMNPPGHTRAPRYVRCKQGTVVRDHGVFAFPDSHAHGKGKKPQHVYSVRFTARAVWGPEAPARDTIRVDLWDDYLDPA